jgi:hypothetical protein
LLFTSATSLPVASAEGTAEQVKLGCARAYEATQERRLDGALTLARDNAAFCAQPSCPAVIRSPCTQWLQELTRSVPSVAISAREGGRDLSDVSVFVDGELVAETLTGRAIDVDPGKHVVRVVHGARPPIEQTIVVVEGSKNRALDFEIPVPGPAPEPEPTRASARSAPVGPILFGGISVASVAVFTVLAASGTRDLDRMRARCGQTRSCLESDIDAARTKIIVGDVFLAATAVTGVIAVGWTIAHYTGEPGVRAPATALRWSVSPQRDGAFGSVSLTY